MAIPPSKTTTTTGGCSIIFGTTHVLSVLCVPGWCNFLSILVHSSQLGKKGGGRSLRENKRPVELPSQVKPNCSSPSCKEQAAFCDHKPRGRGCLCVCCSTGVRLPAGLSAVTARARISPQYIKVQAVVLGIWNATLALPSSFPTLLMLKHRASS